MRKQQRSKPQLCWGVRGALKEDIKMTQSTVSTMAVVCLFGLLSGCYGSSVEKLCKVCRDTKEGKAEGTEWSAEYINEKFQCKLEGGQPKVKVQDYWKDCG
jgi:hypothetical protein